MDNITYEILTTRNPLGIKNLKLSLLRARGSQYDFSFHWHDAVELVLVLDGCGETYVEGRRFSQQAGDLAFSNSGSIHSVTNCTPSGAHYTVLILLIPDEYLQEYVPDMPIPYFDMDSVRHNSAVKDAMYRIAGMMESSAELSSLDKLLVHQELLGILYQLYSDCAIPSPRADKRQELARQVVDFVSAHYSEAISVKDMAARVGLQPNYFCRSFKAQAGISFHQYLGRIRLDAALALLATGKATALDCAVEAGFSSEKVLIDWCKKIYHCTPLQYAAQRNVE